MQRIAIILMLVLTGLALGQDGAGEARTVADVLLEHEELTVFAELLENSGIMEEFNEASGIFTVFAPTDAAFAQLGEEYLAELASNEGAIEFVLRNHVALGGSTFSDLAQMPVLTNVAGHSYLLLFADDTLLINEAEVIVPDLEAVNGVVHIVDSVLLPEPYWNDRSGGMAPAGGGAGSAAGGGAD